MRIESSLFLSIALIALFFDPVCGKKKSVSKIRFEKDSSSNCKDIVKENRCLSNDKATTDNENNMFFKCPVSCCELYAGEYKSSFGRVQPSPEDFLDLEVPILKKKKGKVQVKNLSLEDTEGLITVVAALPMNITSMSQFYYEMLNHIHQIYPYTVEILLLPMITADDDNGSATNNFIFNEFDRFESNLHEHDHEKHIPDRKQSNFKILTPTSKPLKNKLIKYLQNNLPVHTNAHSKNNSKRGYIMDRVTVYVINTTKENIEQEISPTIVKLESIINRYFKRFSMKRGEL